MEKLVRDRIPAIMLEAGITPNVRHVGRGDRLQWLLAKLHEEGDELAAAPSLDECADVLEVLRSIGELLGHTLQEVVVAADAKREARGGFNEGCILVIQE